MVISFLCLALRRFIELVALRPRSSQFKELEIVVLRHQLAILRNRFRGFGALLARSARIGDISAPIYAYRQGPAPFRLTGKPPQNGTFLLAFRRPRA